MLDEKEENMDDDKTVKIEVFKELVPADINKKNVEVKDPVKSNIQELCQRLNKVGREWGRPFVITDGLRSQTQNENMIKAGKTKATKSKHLIGCAADVYDPDGALKQWLRDNPKILEEAQLWCEHWDYTPNWCHFQIVPPGSGNRWFIPW